MKTHRRIIKIMFILIAVVMISASISWAQEQAPKTYPVAIFPFIERDSSVKGYGTAIADILFAKLSERPEIILVERAHTDQIQAELELGLSGIISPSQAVEIGQMTGAKILLTGSIFEVHSELYIVAKVIGMETSRVLGESVIGKAEDLNSLANELSTHVAEAMIKESSKLIASEETIKDRIAALNELLRDAKRPVVLVRIQERHIGQQPIDPAAQTELMLFCTETGFKVIDPDQGSEKSAEVVIDGEGFSEFALRKGNLMSVKARLEVKAVDRATKSVIGAERQTAIAVDLTEQMAGKKALQDAAAAIAVRLLPKLVKK